ncbi:sigma factor [Paracoccus sp. WLY502]|uniref:sigma factor n=1 Tax=Paracoccus yibinensis TaxID=3068891 RepID=UPI002796D692|nr:sigma factor [Paracoccus sp. WLY502]MDQ1902355.1 sigma factor [Paracoccus sp. WLY502]
MNKSSTPEHLSASECNAALETFASNTDQMLRLDKIARRYAGSDLEAEELVQEAFIRILDGDRAWPRGLDTRSFVIKVIQSIASEIRERGKRRKPHMTMTGTLPEDTLPCPDLTAAETLDLLQQDAAMRARMLEYFKDDPELCMLAEALLEGWEKSELLFLFDQDESRYQATRKRFRRRTKKLEATLTKIGEPHDQDQAREADDR